MKEIDPPSAIEVNGGLNPRGFEELPCTDALALDDPRILIDHNPPPLPQ
jgi:hypothetical protein